MNQWFNVNADARIWASHSRDHKQGWIYAPAAILAIEEYKGAYRFKDWRVVDDGRGDFSVSSGYPQFWIQAVDVSLEPYEPYAEPDPTSDPGSEPEPKPELEPTLIEDAALGAAVRVLFDFVFSYFRG